MSALPANMREIKAKAAALGSVERGLSVVLGLFYGYEAGVQYGLL